jgi:hypothetical protein
MTVKSKRTGEDNMVALTFKVPPDLLAAVKLAAEADGFSVYTEWMRVQLRNATRRALPVAEPVGAAR